MVGWTIGIGTGFFMGGLIGFIVGCVLGLLLWVEYELKPLGLFTKREGCRCGEIRRAAQEVANRRWMDN